jgi:hypothetical protein
LVLKNSICDAQWWKLGNFGASPTRLHNYDVKCRRFGFFGVEKFYLWRPIVEIWILVHHRLVCTITTSNVGGSDFLVLTNSICDAQWWKVRNFGASPTSLRNYDVKCRRFGFFGVEKF